MAVPLVVFSVFVFICVWPGEHGGGGFNPREIALGMREAGCRCARG